MRAENSAFQNPLSATAVPTPPTLSRVDAGRPIKVQTLFLKRFVAPRNSDYKHFDALRHLEERIPVRMQLCGAMAATIMGNVAYALESLMYRIPGGRHIALSKAWRGGPKRAIWLPPRYAERTGADVLLTNMLVPVNRQRVPLVFEFDFFAFGLAERRREVERLQYVPGWMIDRTTAVRVQFEHSLKAFQERYPDQAWKGVMIPHYLPHLEPLSEEAVRTKFETMGKQEIRILFVGNLARLKGLPELLGGFEIARRRVPRLRLTIVSRFSDGPVDIPAGVDVRSDISLRDVYGLMRDAHIYAMPTKREPTGAVFFEAMAHGCALGVPDVLPHRDLFGPFGVVADPRSPKDWADALEALASDPARARRAGLAGRARFIEKYYRAKIEQQYLALFRSVSDGTFDGQREFAAR